MQLFKINQEYGRYCRRNKTFRCPSKNFNKPTSFKLRRIPCENTYKPYNAKYANRMYNSIFIKASLKYDNDDDF